jgi:hypothetical protein
MWLTVYTSFFYCQKYRQLPDTSDIRSISLGIEYHFMLYSYKHKTETVEMTLKKNRH